MTQIILQPDEFIIKLNRSVVDIVTNPDEPISLQVINPHSDGNFDMQARDVVVGVLKNMTDAIAMEKIRKAGNREGS